MAQSGETQLENSVRVTDARGRVVTQLDPVVMHTFRQPGVIPAEVVRSMAEEIGVGWTKGTRTLRFLSIVGWICLMFGLVGAVLGLISGGGIGRALIRMLPFTGAAMLPFLLWARLRRDRFKQVTEVMLRRRHCPHCGYDLRGLPVDANDDATVCPECGCAWKLGGAAG
jgi:hypothetical protein